MTQGSPRSAPLPLPWGQSVTMARREQQRAFATRTAHLCSQPLPQMHPKIILISALLQNVVKDFRGKPRPQHFLQQRHCDVEGLTRQTFLNGAHWAAPSNAPSMGVRTAMELRVLLLLPLCFPGRRRAGHASGFPRTREQWDPFPHCLLPVELCSGGESWHRQGSELGSSRQGWGEKGQPGSFSPAARGSDNGVGCWGSSKHCATHASIEGSRSSTSSTHLSVGFKSKIL